MKKSKQEVRKVVSLGKMAENLPSVSSSVGTSARNHNRLLHRNRLVIRWDFTDYNWLAKILTLM